MSAARTIKLSDGEWMVQQVAAAFIQSYLDIGRRRDGLRDLLQSAGR
jgi:hypothetical protein